MPLQPIGILVNASLYHRIVSGRTKHEKLSFYEEAASYYDMFPCYFRLQDIRPSAGEVFALVPKGFIKGYHRIKMPLPKVIHNRAIYSRTQSQQRLNELASQSFIYNLCNRYGKLHIYDLLMQNENIRPHLPATVNATILTLKQFMERYESLILKPNKGSIGKGIYKLDKSTKGWVLQYKRHKKWKRITFSSRLPSFLRQRINQKKYIVQQCLPLAKFQDRPFDLRVSVQKNITGIWQVTGIVGKLAQKNRFLTNVGQGGKVYPFSTLMTAYPHLNVQAVEENIKQFALTIAEELSKHLPNLADLGMDIGITEHGYPLFIESNGKDQRYSFRDANMMNEWKATYANPIGYGRYWLDLNN